MYKENAKKIKIQKLEKILITQLKEINKTF